MKLLLDTHIWLWMLLDERRLAAPVHAALESADNELWLSPVSVWEAVLAGQRRRVTLEPTPAAWVRTSLDMFPMREAPFNFEVALESRALDAHEDPADRFLAATARVFDLTLVTADRRLARVKGVHVLRNSTRP